MCNKLHCIFINQVPLIAKDGAGNSTPTPPPSGVPWVNALGGTEWKSDKCEGAKRGSGGRGYPPSQDREIFQFLRSKSSDLVHAVMRFLTLYLIRIWIKIITYSTTQTETGSEFVSKKKN